MKTKFLIILALTLAISIVFFYQCSSNKVVPDVCFNKNILPIFVSKCTTSGCHSGGGKSQGGVNLSTYEGIMSKVKPYYPLQSEVYTQCTGNNPEMPPSQYSKLTSTELEYIKYWIHTGAKNATDCGGTTCDTTTISYANRVKPLLDTWCKGCHDKGNAGGGFDLSDYTNVIKSITPDNRLIGSIKQLSGYYAMPKGTNKWSECDIKAVQKWVDAGYPNN